MRAIVGFGGFKVGASFWAWVVVVPIANELDNAMAAAM